MNPTNLNLLTDPINKMIKPNQIYNDYILPVKAISPEKVGNNYNMPEMTSVHYLIDLSKPQCSCDCHKRQKDCSESF